SYCASSAGITLTSAVTGGLTPYGYTWKNGSGTTVGNSSTYFATASSTYKVYVTDSLSPNSCPTAIDSVTVTKYSIPTTANAGPDQSLCNVTSATLAGNTAAIGSGTWILVSGPNSPTITTTSSPT